jgi:hypothetical protein
MEPYARLKRRIRYSTHGGAPPSDSTSNDPTPTAPSRILTPRFALAYNPPCSDPT